WFRLGAIRWARDGPAAAAAAYAEAAAAGADPYAWMGRLNQAGALLSDGDVDGARAAYVLAAALPEPRAREAAEEAIAQIDGVGPEERAERVARRLVEAPDWYQARDILHADLGLLPELIAYFEELVADFAARDLDPAELWRYLRLLRRAA